MNNIDIDSLNIQEFKKLRKSAYYSVKKYAEGNGYEFTTSLFEDSFQSALLHHLKYKSAGENWLRERNLPLQAILNKYSRQQYSKEVHWLNTDSLENLLDEIEGDTSISRKASQAYFALGFSDTRLENTIFFQSLKEVLPVKQYKTAKMLSEGYRQVDIARKLKVSKPMVTRYVKNLRLALAAGVHAT